MNGSAVNTIYAEIQWHCFPQRIEIERKNGRDHIRSRGVALPYDPTIHGPLDNPAQNDNKYWQKVSQLYFAFEDKNFDNIQRFYQKYGFLEVLPTRRRRNLKLPVEDWDYTKAALEWFNLLTSMTRWIKERNISPIKELFEKEKKFRIQTAPASKYSSARYWDKSFLLRGPENADFHIYSNLKHEGGEEQLLRATWNAILNALWNRFLEVNFSPPRATSDSYEGFNHSWSFYANGAFQAAFLQWYFQELAHYKVTKCARVGCDNPVIPASKKRGLPKIYCSINCRWSANKQKGRQKKAESKAANQG